MGGRKCREVEKIEIERQIKKGGGSIKREVKEKEKERVREREEGKGCFGLGLSISSGPEEVKPYWVVTSNCNMNVGEMQEPCEKAFVD